MNSWFSLFAKIKICKKWPTVLISSTVITDNWISRYLYDIVQEANYYLFSLVLFIMTSTTFYPINKTLSDQIFDQSDVDHNPIQIDFFENVYSDPILNGCMIAVYLFGCIGCAGLGLVIWFERSGSAGPYRTLVNQLVSYNLLQVE